MKTADTIRRTIHPETRVLDAAKGLVEYVASDQTIDSYREVIRADGWRFDLFTKNAPFVDSHNYDTIENLLGKVLDFRLDRGRLVETVQWAKDVEANRLAVLGWQMTEAGFLKAVSVGFRPVRAVAQWDNRAEFNKEAAHLGVDPEAVRVIYQEQQQLELSACIIGANPAALAKAYKAEILQDSDLDMLATARARAVAEMQARVLELKGPDAHPDFHPEKKPATDAHKAAEASAAWRQRFLGDLERCIQGTKS